MNDLMRKLMEQPEWMHDANCHGIDAEVFFPTRGEDTRAAKRICGHCDVQAECLAYAMNGEERYGIWGGLSERERRALRSGRPVRLRPIEHGTNAGYHAHLRRSVPTCTSCLEAHAAFVAEAKKRLA